MLDFRFLLAVKVSQVNSVKISYTVWDASSERYRSYVETVVKTNPRIVKAIASLSLASIDGGWEYESSQGMVSIDSIHQAHSPTAEEVTQNGRYSCD